MTIFAFAGGSFIFIGVTIAFSFAVVYGFYNVRGSGSKNHPNDGLYGAPGAAARGEASAKAAPAKTTATGSAPAATFRPTARAER
jgi:hypothetical protein